MKTFFPVLALAVAGVLSGYAGYTAARSWQGAAMAWALAAAAIGAGAYALRETAAKEAAEDLETRGCQFPRAGMSFRVRQQEGRMNG